MNRRHAPARFALLAALALGAPRAPARPQAGGAVRPPSLARAAAKPSAATAATWKLRRTLTGHEGAVYSASFFPGGARVVTSGDDGRIRVWEVATGLLLRTAEGPGGSVSDVAVSPDGRLVAACTDGGGAKVELRDARTLRVLRTLSGHEEGVFEVVFSPDGRLLASGGRDKVIRVWDVRTGKLLRRLEGHDDAVTALAFAPDGRRLAS
ncbi:MAG TPA: WD40 repeat domain-containing protein, partial [Pyrinomonadaceae bacterium]